MENLTGIQLVALGALESFHNALFLDDRQTVTVQDSRDLIDGIKQQFINENSGKESNKD